MPGRNPFQTVRAASPRRSVFNLSHERKFTCDMGQLIPTLAETVIPGDKFKIGNQIVIRMQPLVAPVLHEINAFVHYFFVPFRILWDEWEDFITGGVDGESAAVLPRWEVTPSTGNAIGSLWDYFGFPTGVDPDGSYPTDFVRRAYNMIYNEYYRDETLQSEVSLSNEAILNRNWFKDYFTSALPWQQRGTSPALPVSGITNAEFDWASLPSTAPTAVLTSGYTGLINMAVRNVAHSADPNQHTDQIHIGATNEAAANAAAALSRNTVDLSNATTFNIADLRFAFAVQRFLERNARGGIRYVEFLQSQYGVRPRDDRMMRPEYIGGSRSPIIISEVLQTSSTDTTSPQGNLAGHGITADAAYAGSYYAVEHGIIIGIMSVMPASVYQQGIDRQFLQRDRLEYYFPTFANLSEQEIRQAEIFATNVESENNTIFGYQGRYDEYRVRRSLVCGLMRTDFDYWHLSRQFSSAPLLNSSFITCIPRKDIFAVPSEPGLIVSIANMVRAVRPMPIQAEPGLIDHN